TGLKKFINKFPDLLKSKENYSFYFQIAYDNQDNRILVLNKIGPGLGKHFSRYGNLFLNSEYKENNRFINSLIEQYKKYDQNGGVLTDLNAVLGLNLNMHPNLLNYEITYPGCNPSKGINQVALKDIEVLYDSNSDQLKLYSKQYRQNVKLLPLGFLFPALSPSLYKFLCGFSESNGIEYSFWNKFLNEHNNNFSLLPRIMLGSVALDRRTWKINAKEIQKEFSKDTFETFINFHKWVKENQLPEDIFLRVANTMDAFSENELLNQDLGSWIAEIKQTKHRKPQYVNFNNYFHIDALRKIIKDVNNTVTIQEVYPHPDDVYYQKNSKKCVEFLVEVF
ncbi:lantibiotic dehydratase, partial [Bacillus cereus]|uniref:lantibiotic dehydratase n=1 Tax=Bacillus cereus TaxID=1396 RepID=UPI0009CC2446